MALDRSSADERSAPWRTRRPLRRSTDGEPVRGWLPTVGVALSIALADWMTKAAVIRAIPESGFLEVIPDSLALWHVRNPAMILGLYGDLPLEVRKLIALSAALVGAVLMAQVMAYGQRLPREHRPWAWLFVGLVMGGMLGNLGERAVHWGVTDFISLGWGGTWLPPGNIADLALFASIPLACVVIMLELFARTRRQPEAASAEAMGD